MGNLKSEALKSNEPNEDTRVHTLTANEADLLRSLNASLKFHTLASQIISQFLFYIAVYRLDYPLDSNLQFNFNFEDPEATELTVTLLGNSPTPPTV